MKWFSNKTSADFEEKLDRLRADFEYKLEQTQDRITLLQIELATQEEAHKADLAELRERVGTSTARRPSGRPFSVLQHVAEKGARAKAAEQSNGS